MNVKFNMSGSGIEKIKEVLFNTFLKSHFEVDKHFILQIRIKLLIILNKNYLLFLKVLQH